MTKTPPKLASLKSGDLAWLVEQSVRGYQRREYWVEVLSIGRKYGYILRHDRKESFDLTTGQSVHDKDSNARYNGHGFDVWPSKEAHETHIATIEANTRLVTRLSGLRRNQHSATLDNASPELVTDLHAVLDRHGV